MADETTRKYMSDLQAKAQKENEGSVLDDIRNSLAELNKNQDSIQKILESQKAEDLKEKIEDKPKQTDKAEVIKDEPKKELSALRKVFQESFSSVKDFISPGGIMKSFGLLSGSPLFMLMGDKFDDLLSKYSEYRQESKEANKDQAIAQSKSTDILEKQSNIQNETMKDDFMAEERINQQTKLAEEQNELLEEIRDKEFTIADEKGGLGDMLKAPFAMLGKILPKSLAGVLGGGALGGLLGLGKGGKRGKGLLVKGGGGLLRDAGKAGKGLSAKGGGGLLKGAGKILKGGGRLLGKAALPLALITSGFDFIKGFKDSLEITGKDDITSKIQAGISKVISGFTFGLIDSKTIFKGIDFLTNKLKDIFMSPLNLLKDIASGENIIDATSKYISTLTFGLISKETLSKGISFLTNKLKDIFMSPFNLIKDIVSGKSIIDSISQYISTVSFGLISSETINKGISFISDKIRSILSGPIEYIKDKAAEFGPRLLNGLLEKMSNLTFGLISPEQIGTGIRSIYEKITGSFMNIFSDIKNVFSKIDLFGFLDDVDLSFGLDTNKMKESFDNLKNIIKEKLGRVVDFLTEPIKQVKNFLSKITSSFGFGFGDDIDTDMIQNGKSQNYNTKEGSQLLTSHRVNPILERVEKITIKEKEIEKQKQLIKEKMITEQQINNNIVTSTNNTMVVQEDLSTRPDDLNILNALTF